MLLQKDLSNTEFEVMKIVWNNNAPITTNIIMEQLGKEKKWKLPTILSLMTRLVDKGFIRTEKLAKERLYYPIVDRDKYLALETKKFMKSYHDNSLKSFVDLLFEDEEIKDSDINELIDLLKEKNS